ncbi:hypothetical protein HDU79_007277 [Rhizoclosmatium sp. JEL0117]|nr:hypothetical protein HDU79_007277 [Rhizoclosmatium sp. JEL0117]
MRGLVVLVALLTAALGVAAQRFLGVYIEAGKDISKIDYTSVTHVFYAFASLDAATGNLKLPSQFNQAIVDSIHAGNPRRPKAILSVGGYYETAFSPIFNNNTLRQNFVNSTINTIQQYGLDGVDIDWEYPGRAGISNNYLSVDSANFVLGLKALKTGLNAKGLLASISATSLPYGFIGADGNYLTDLSGYAANLDFLNIMGYDLNGGSWTTSSAPNAPLGTPLNGDKSAGGIDGSIQKLIKAGFPANKLVLGVPFYGRYVKTVQSMATNGPNNQAASSNSGQPGSWIDYSAITSQVRALPNSGTVIDITVLSNGVILGTGPDFNIYSRQTLNSNWVLVSGGCCVYSTAQALDGSILGIGTDNAVYWKQSLSSNWQYLPNSKGVLAVAPRVLIVGIGMDKSLYSKGSLTGGWTQIPSKFRFLDMVQLPDLTFVAVGPSNDLWTCKTLSDCAQAPRPGGIKSIDVLTDGVTLVAVGMDGLLYTRTIASDWTQVPNSGTVVDITVLANGVILGTAPDGYLYTKNTLTSSWQYLGACCVSRTAQLPDGSILGIGTDNAIYKKQTLNAGWTYVANSAAVMSVVSLY